MTRLVRGAVAGAGVLGLVLSAPALAASGPQQNLVTGEGLFGFAQVHISAHGDPMTRAARGSFTLSQGGLEVEGDVTCLQVDGNNAVAGGVITRSSDPSLVGQAFHQYTTDNGSPGSSDRSDTEFYGDANDCSVIHPGGLEVEQGNYVVKQGG